MNVRQIDLLPSTFGEKYQNSDQFFEPQQGVGELAVLEIHQDNLQRYLVDTSTCFQDLKDNLQNLKNGDQGNIPKARACLFQLLAFSNQLEQDCNNFQMDLKSVISQLS
jgi:hypothetical protein